MVLLLQLRHAPVLDLAHLGVVLAALRGFELEPGGLDLLLDLRRALKRGLLGLPHFLQVVVLALEHLDLRFKIRSEEHTSELQSLMRNSYAVFCLKKTYYTNKKQ